MLDKVSKIEVDFAIPVELSDADYHDLDKLVGRICGANCPKGWAFWPAGCGNKPHFNPVDCAMLGKPYDPSGPSAGEPTFDDSVYYVECSAREKYPEEIVRDEARAAKERRRKSSMGYRLHRFLRRIGASVRAF